MSVLHEIRLRPEGVRHMRDVQVAHATIAAMLPGLWAMPLRDLIIVRASEEATVALQPRLVREHRAHLDAPAPPGPVRLSVIANPTADRVNHADGSKRRVPLPISECQDWLRRKLSGIVDLSEVATEDMGTGRGWRQRNRISVRRVAFDAVGMVRDRNALQQVMDAGLGRARAYGCGLLLAVPA